MHAGHYMYVCKLSMCTQLYCFALDHNYDFMRTFRLEKYSSLLFHWLILVVFCGWYLLERTRLGVYGWRIDYTLLVSK